MWTSPQQSLVPAVISLWIWCLWNSLHLAPMSSEAGLPGRFPAASQRQTLSMPGLGKLSETTSCLSSTWLCMGRKTASFWMPTIYIVSVHLDEMINTVSTSDEYETIMCHKTQPSSASVSLLEYCNGNRVPNILFETYLHLTHFRIALYKFIINSNISVNLHYWCCFHLC